MKKKQRKKLRKFLKRSIYPTLFTQAHQSAKPKKELFISVYEKATGKFQGYFKERTCSGVALVINLEKALIQQEEQAKNVYSLSFALAREWPGFAFIVNDREVSKSPFGAPEAKKHEHKIIVSGPGWFDEVVPFVGSWKAPESFEQLNKLMKQETDEEALERLWNETKHL